MATLTKIEWCHHTFNPWRGCTKISPGCTNCYAETWGIRQPTVFGEWGDKGQRVIASEAYWHAPFLWDKKARVAGERRRVFCASLADVFEDRPELVEPRVRIWSTIRQTPNLDWLLLTKRPENIAGMLPDDWGDGYPNVWLGVSVENQKYADERIPDLLRVPAAVRFVSYEPALGPVDFRHIQDDGMVEIDALTGDHGVIRPLRGRSDSKLSWIIIGGESGPKSRPFDLTWARSLRDQCQEAGVPFFLKQLGSNPFGAGDDFYDVFRDKKGGSMEEWPEDLRVREFPQPVKAGA